MNHAPASLLNRIAATARWTEAQAREVLAAVVASGLGVAEFAARHGVQAQRIYLWRRKLGASDKQLARRPMFVEVAPRLSAPAGGRYEITTPHGETLRIEGPVDAQAVRSLVAILREGRACWVSPRPSASSSPRTRSTDARGSMVCPRW
jgi:transposase-like protein